MTGSLRKWVYKAIDIKSILIQECVGFFPLFLTGIYQCVMTWQSEADELPSQSRTLGPEGRLWAMVLVCAQQHIKIKCQFCAPDFYQHWSLQLFPTLRDTSLSFTAVSLRNLSSNCLVLVSVSVVCIWPGFIFFHFRWK